MHHSTFFQSYSQIFAFGFPWFDIFQRSGLIRARNGRYIHHDILIDEGRFNGYFNEFMWLA